VSALVEGVRAGDERAVRSLVEEVLRDRAERRPQSRALALVCAAFRPGIVAFLGRQFFRGDDQTVAEVWNETLERAYFRIERFDSKRSKFSTWLFYQARYVSLDWIRERDRHARLPDLGLELQGEHLADPLSSLMIDVQEGALRRAFMRLNEQQQRLLFLRHVLGCRHAEIARHRLSEAVPEDHVRVYVNRATKKLRELYAEESTAPSAGPPERELELDEVWPIERVVAEIEASGEYEQLACLQADLEAARIGRSLRQGFDASLMSPSLEVTFRRELDELRRHGSTVEQDELTDEEVDQLLRSEPEPV
jgi:RNA polymerase sigma factor (sigma-70 family)